MRRQCNGGDLLPGIHAIDNLVLLSVRPKGSLLRRPTNRDGRRSRSRSRLTPEQRWNVRALVAVLIA